MARTMIVSQTQEPKIWQVYIPIFYCRLMAHLGNPESFDIVVFRETANGESLIEIVAKLDDNEEEVINELERFSKQKYFEFVNNTGVQQIQ